MKIKNSLLLQMSFRYSTYGLIDLLRYHDLLDHTFIMTSDDEKERFNDVPSSLQKRGVSEKLIQDRLIELDNYHDCYEVMLENPTNIFLFNKMNGSEIANNIKDISDGDIDQTQIWGCEKGWIPWSRSYYYTQGSRGVFSILAKNGMEYINNTNPNRYDSIQREFKKYLKHFDKKKGNEDVSFNNFILLLLQKNDEKLRSRYTPFKNQKEFFDFVTTNFPDEKNIIVKQHPFNRDEWIKTEHKDRVTDVSDSNVKKKQLFDKADAIVTQNSTTAIEALVFGKKVFTYGREVFSNKNVTYENIHNEEKIKELIESPTTTDRIKRIRLFVSFLEKNQLDHKKMYENINVADYYESRWFIKQIKNQIKSLKNE